MKNTVKKAVLFIGVISILFGLSPIATYYGYDFPGLSFWLTEVEAATSGTCGDDLTWSLNMSTGELEINGTGEMKNYSSNSATPWYSYETYIGKVIINNGPTTIGNNASLIFDKFPYTNSLFISSPTTKKNIAIKRSFISRCKLNSPNILIRNLIKRAKH